MRRKERQITDRSKIDAILNEAELLNMALTDGTTPYALCVNFGYDGKAVYIHGAKEGKKMDILAKNATVCFQAVCGYDLVVKKEVGEFTSRYRSVVGMGRAEILTDLAEKRYGLDVLMEQCAPGEPYSFDDKLVMRTEVIKIVIDSLDGKQSGY